MAEESESGQERTEEATPRRLQQARERGDHPRSQELATAAVFLGALLTLLALGGWIAGAFRGWFIHRLQLVAQGQGMADQLLHAFGISLLEALAYASPVILACLLAGFIAPAVMGFGFSSEALSPNLERLSPLAGIKRLWGTQAIGELVKSVLRVLLLGSIAVAYFRIAYPDLLALMHEPLDTAVPRGAGMILGLMLAMGLGIGLLAALDAPFQWWQWKRRLRMTRQELIEEMKESEGRPEVKSQIRRLQQEMSRKRMMDEVPRADVVVVNPTHYAVAIRYDGSRMRAPQVVAKGVDEVALNIRRVAEEARVAVVSAPPLARALNAQVALGQEIPVKLYQAVAQVLSYVYQLKHWHPARGPMPSLPDFRDLEEGGPPTGA